MQVMPEYLSIAQTSCAASKFKYAIDQGIEDYVLKQTKFASAIILITSTSNQVLKEGF